MDYSFIWFNTVNRILYILLFFPINVPTVKQFPHKHIIKILITVLTNTAWQIIWYIPVLMPVIIDIIQTKYTVFQVRSIIKISSPSVGFKYFLLMALHHLAVSNHLVQPYLYPILLLFITNMKKVDICLIRLDLSLWIIYNNKYISQVRNGIFVIKAFVYHYIMYLYTCKRRIILRRVIKWEV